MIRSELFLEYAEREGKDHVSEFGSVKEDLKETVEVASRSLIFQSDRISDTPRDIGHHESMSAISGLPFPVGLYLALGLACEKLLLGYEHIVEHL